VVGHIFFWALKSNLSNCRSYERFYIILERFLCCCGNFKYTLFKQNQMNLELIKIASEINL